MEIVTRLFNWIKLDWKKFYPAREFVNFNSIDILLQQYINIPKIIKLKQITGLKKSIIIINYLLYFLRCKNYSFYKYLMD